MKKIIVLISFFLTNALYAHENLITPFKLGSYYEYIFEETSLTVRYNARIVSEKVMNGRLYQEMEVYNEPPMNKHSIFFSFDTVSLNVYGGEGARCPDSIGHKLAIGFNLDSGFQWNDCSTGTYFISTLFQKEIAINVFGTKDTLEYVVRKDTAGFPIEGVTFYGYLEKFGYVYFYRGYGGPLGGGPYSKQLVGAIIDGVTYGSVILDVNQLSNSVPYEYELHQNFPNPFNPSTAIKFSLVKSSIVNLQIFDQLGRQVKELVNEKKSAGTYQYIFNAANLASGIYYYRLQADNFVETKQMLLVK